MRLRYLSFALALVLLSGAWVCNQQPPEMTARDAIAAAKGATDSVQAKWHDSCVANPAQRPCVLINQAGAARNLTVDALEAYCGGPEFDAGTGPCQPPKDGEIAAQLLVKLQSTTANLNQIIADVQALAPPAKEVKK